MQNSFQNERIIIFGASRGLGAAVASTVKSAEVLALSRKLSGHDFSREADQEKAIELAQKFLPTRLFYFAGGGPHGAYTEKNWRDHEWALKVNFLFPARLIHLFSKVGIEQIIVTGSAVAESQPDKNATSYSAAKHALKALFENLQNEKLNFDLRLFSPGYMDTDLLPKNSWPRELENVLDPAEVARSFCDWAFDLNGEKHKILK